MLLVCRLGSLLLASKLVGSVANLRALMIAHWPILIVLLEVVRVEHRGVHTGPIGLLHSLEDR